MLSAIDLFSPASSWNWLANLTRAARLASSLTILSWSFSVIEGDTSCRDDKRGDPRLSHLRRTSRRFFWTHHSPLADARTTHMSDHATCDKVACQRFLKLEFARARGPFPAGSRRCFSSVVYGRRNMVCIFMARPMSPLILSLPLMNAAVGSRPPVKTLTKSREPAIRARCGLSTPPSPDVPTPPPLF